MEDLIHGEPKPEDQEDKEVDKSFKSEVSKEGFMSQETPDFHAIVDDNGILSFVCNICKDGFESVDALEKHHEEVHLIEMEAKAENDKIEVTKVKSYSAVTTQDNDVNSPTENNTSKSPRKKSPKKLPEAKGSSKGQTLNTTAQIKFHQDDHKYNPNVRFIQ